MGLVVDPNGRNGHGLFKGHGCLIPNCKLFALWRNKLLGVLNLG